jgi:hypothetical protein
VHINIQGETWYQPPTWPERPGEQAKMLHFEGEADDLGSAVANALEAGGTQVPWQPPDRNPERFDRAFWGTSGARIVGSAAGAERHDGGRPCGARRALIMGVWSAGSLSGDGEWFGEVPRA